MTHPTPGDPQATDAARRPDSRRDALAVVVVIAAFTVAGQQLQLLVEYVASLALPDAEVVLALAPGGLPGVIGTSACWLTVGVAVALGRQGPATACAWVGVIIVTCGASPWIVMLLAAAPDLALVAAIWPLTLGIGAAGALSVRGAVARGHAVLGRRGLTRLLVAGAVIACSGVVVLLLFMLRGWVVPGPLLAVAAVVVTILVPLALVVAAVAGIEPRTRGRVHAVLGAAVVAYAGVQFLLPLPLALTLQQLAR
ncbi:hypothetical protein GCM10009682_38110 [Luedemannella flava]|uniref:Uncharacterized protein n=1 Tax=Luedemannella flava TaxID=349316 RepID=A0ABP4YHP1_9ACTN